MSTLSRSGLAIFVCLVSIVAGGCGDDDDGGGSGSLLAACAASGDCRSGLSCECGVCTSACTDDTACASIRADATCEATSGVAACGVSPTATQVCAVRCTSDADCSANEPCADGWCLGDAPAMDAGTTSDGGTPDAARPDGALPDAGGPIDCEPHVWSCTPSGTAARYCNAAGDGYVRTVDCGGRACTDGLCEPLRRIDFLCGAIKNGVQGEIVGGVPCPSMPNSLDGGWAYAVWLDRADTITVQADALSPLVEVQVTIVHPCEWGMEGTCTTVERSMAGGGIEVAHTAARRGSARVRFEMFRASGDPSDVDGARMSYDVLVEPADPLPAAPAPLCTAGTRSCPQTHQLTYCQADGQFTLTHNCWPETALPENVCTDGLCESPRGETCDDVTIVTRPPSDELMLDGTVDGFHNDVDPGTHCLDVGMGGADRIYRVDLAEGERIRARLQISSLMGGEIHGLYLLQDCRAPVSSCTTGEVGYRWFTSGGGGAEVPEIVYVAPTDQSVFLVSDTQFGDSDIYKFLEIRWDGSCTDGVSNGDETGIDCGGPCGPCPDGQPCNLDEECESRRCEGTTSPVCTRPAGCGDAVLSLGEECDDGNQIDADWCSDGCIHAACDDSIQNGDETAVDDGGSCRFPLRDRCRRAEPLPLFVDFSFDPNVYVDFVKEGTVADASNSISPSCGIDGPDHAFRVPIQEPSEMRFHGLALGDRGIDPSRSVSVSVRRGCDGAEVACVTSIDGEALIERLALEPGEYIVWVDGLPPGDTGRYELIVGGVKQR